MKRLLFVVAGLLVSLNLAYANDLLFKASNGALNQNSVGVKKLTETELMQVKAGWFGFQRAPGFDFHSGSYSSYAYFVFDTTVSNYATPAALSSAAIKLGFDPKYYGYDVKIVGKIRWINGRKEHFMQAGTSRDNIGNIWHYGAMTPIYNAFRQRY